MSAAKPGELGIVIIGRNEGERLRASLRSAIMACPNVIYADSASTDGSVELAQSMGVLTVSVDETMPLNAARGRNAGLRLLQEKFPHCLYVQFMDGDCVLQPGWVEQAIEFLEMHQQAAVACGRRFEAHANASFYNMIADEEWNTPVGRTEACGGDAMMRIAALDQVGAFNPSLMASEEPELTARLRNRGWEIWRLDALMTEHDARIFTFGQWWKRTTRAGYGYAQAWRSTVNIPERVNGKLLRSEVIWIVILPALVIVLTMVLRRPSVALLLPLLYLAQIVRIAIRRPKLDLFGLKASGLLMVAKVPELIGALRFMLLPHRSAMIEYKTISTAASAEDR